MPTRSNPPPEQSARERLEAVLARHDVASVGARIALEAAAEIAEEWFLDHGGKTHEPIAVAEAIRALAASLEEPS